MSRAAEVEAKVLSVSNSRASSSVSESRLPDRLGTSAEYRPSELLAEIEIAGVVALASETGSQQNVSLFHNRQLKFSSLRLSSRDPAQRKKTIVGLVYNDICTIFQPWIKDSPVHMLKRFSTLRVSTLCIRPTSTVKTGASSLEGMVMFLARSHELL
jgi:hypothetical protein